jgi:hypothetical protein
VKRWALGSTAAFLVALAAVDGMKMGYVRTILLFVIAVAMVVGGLLLLAFGLSAPGPGKGWFVAGGPMLGFFGLYLLWEDFIAPLFARR